LRERGAEYFLVPATARWWLTHYAELGKYLSDHCDLLAEREETGVLFALPERTASDEGPAPDYRGFVGPADKYDLVGAMQFNLLTALGLREHHRLLDVGCGSLRGGRLFIPYLLPGHYFGIEPAQWLVREGFERELGQDMQRVKWPNFHHGNDFQLSVFGRSFDFIIAQSIFSHAATCQIRRCLSEAAKVMKPRAIFAATYFE